MNIKLMRHREQNENRWWYENLRKCWRLKQISLKINWKARPGYIAYWVGGVKKDWKGCKRNRVKMVKIGHGLLIRRTWSCKAEEKGYIKII